MALTTLRQLHEALQNYQIPSNVRIYKWKENNNGMERSGLGVTVLNSQIRIRYYQKDIRVFFTKLKKMLWFSAIADGPIRVSLYNVAILQDDWDNLQFEVISDKQKYLGDMSNLILVPSELHDSISELYP